MTKDDIRRRREAMARSNDWAIRIFVATCVVATVVWIKVLFQALSMIGGK